MSTQDNLQDAFAGESQANRKYLAFSARAEKDGYPQIAKLFRAAAAAETVHAHAHLRVMKDVKETADNLKAAIAGETYEFQEMYPKFIEDAQGEGNQGAVVSFKNAMAVEEIHAQLYQQALSSLDDGKDLPETTIHVCEICGNTVKGEAPDRCPICNAPKERFSKVA